MRDPIITSKIMKSIHSTNTKPEILVRKLIYASGVRGYRVNYRKLPGTPDICFTRWKIAIFINGCFWHRCPYCNPSYPSVNKAFWDAKFSRNITRDRKNRKELREMGWSVITIWECKLTQSPERQLKRILNKLDQLKQENQSS